MAEENEPQQEIEPQEQAEEPSMDEILGSIREILSDDGKTAEGQDAPNTDQAPASTGRHREQGLLAKHQRAKHVA